LIINILERLHGNNIEEVELKKKEKEAPKLLVPFIQIIIS